MKSILLHVNADEGQPSRLQAAIDLARAHGGRIHCVAITPYSAYAVGDPFIGAFMLAESSTSITEHEEQQRAEIEQRLSHEALRFDYTQLSGDAPLWITNRARLADVIVLSRTLGVSLREEPLPIVADVAIHARAPVLAVPPELERFDPNGPILIAWNGSAESATALRFALPMLQMASGVHLLTVDEPGKDVVHREAIEYLACHDLTPELIEFAQAGRDPAAALLAEAEAIKATCIVMGAYGHSRAREWLLGGVTRRLLATSPFPLLLAH